MKTLIKSLALALSLAVVTSSATFAETNPGGKTKEAATYKTGIFTSKSGQLNIALDKETGGAIDVRLTGADGQVLYSQHVGKNDKTYRAKLNLNGLGDGVYQVEITNGVDVTTHKVVISTKLPAAPDRLITIKESTFTTLKALKGSPFL